MALTAGHVKARIEEGLGQDALAPRERAKLTTGQQPSSPARSITVNGSGGTRVSDDGLLVTQRFQTLVRAEDYDAAEGLALRVDRIIVPALKSPADDPYPLVLRDPAGDGGEGTRVLMAGHVGGGPQPAATERNGVTTFSCNHWMVAER